MRTSAMVIVSAIMLMAMPALAEGPKRDRAGHGEKLFQSLDKNHDGVLTADELPARLKQRMPLLAERVDKNKDKKIDKAEFLAVAKALAGHAKQGRAAPRRLHPSRQFAPHGCGIGCAWDCPYCQGSMAARRGPGMQQPGMRGPGMQRFGTHHPGMSGFGMSRFGMQHPGMRGPGMQRLGTHQPGMQRFGMGHPGMMQRGMMYRGMARPGAQGGCKCGQCPLHPWMRSMQGPGLWGRGPMSGRSMGAMGRFGAAGGFGFGGGGFAGPGPNRFGPMAQGQRPPMGPQSGKPDPKEFFKKLDRNLDGKLDPEEFAAGMAMFHRGPMSTAGPGRGAFSPMGVPPGASEEAKKRMEEAMKKRSEEMKKRMEEMKKKAAERGGPRPEGMRHQGPPGTPHMVPRFGGLLEHLKELDKNKDGKVSRDEAPPMLKENFDRIDANHDGQLTEDEIRAGMAKMAEHGRPGRPGDVKKPEPAKPEKK